MLKLNYPRILLMSGTKATIYRARDIISGAKPAEFATGVGSTETMGSSTYITVLHIGICRVHWSPTTPTATRSFATAPHHRRPLPEGVAIRRFLLHQHNIVITILVVTHREAAPLVQLRPTKCIFACRCRIWSSIYVRSLQESKAHMW